MLQKGADAIQKLAYSSAKLTKISEKMFVLDKQLILVESLSITGTYKVMRQKLIHLLQQETLREMEIKLVKEPQILHISQSFATGKESRTSSQIDNEIL